MRSLTRVVVVVALLMISLGAATLPAGASQDVPFSVHKGPAGNPNRWHAEISGLVTFYGANRRFDVNGTGVYHHSPSNDGVGYTEVQQDVANTSRDPRYKVVTEGSCTSDTSVPGITWTCVLGRSFSNATAPGHGLAGVRIRVCIEQIGVDPCGRVQYLDNPLL